MMRKSGKAVLAALSAASLVCLTLLVGTSARAEQASAVAPGSALVNLIDGPAPGSITAAGITVYGSFDVGLTYQSHGTPLSSVYYQGLEYLIQRNSNRSQFNLAPNANERSTIGLRGKEALGNLTGLDTLAGWYGIFDLQIGYVPTSLSIDDGPRSLTRQNGVPLGQQLSGGDGTRAGQLFNGDAYGGLKHDVYGELRFGRQQTVFSDQVYVYDPQRRAYAFSLLGSGTWGGGMGATEDSNLNNSFKYKNTFGPLHVAAQYQFEGGGQGGEAVLVGGGVDFTGALAGLSVDGFLGRKKDAIVASALPFGTSAAKGQCNGSTVVCPGNTLNGVVSDNEAFAVLTKYKAGQFTGFAGFERITFSNASDPLSSANTVGGYQLNLAAGPFGINTQAFQTDRVIDLTWIGARYAFTPKLTGAVAWYRLLQENFIAGVATQNGNGSYSIVATPCSGVGSSATIRSNCGGREDVLSVSLDYQATQRLDVFGGVLWSEVNGGLASGFLHKENIAPIVGASLKF